MKRLIIPARWALHLYQYTPTNLVRVQRIIASAYKTDIDFINEKPESLQGQNFHFQRASLASIRFAI